MISSRPRLHLIQINVTGALFEQPPKQASRAGFTTACSLSFGTRKARYCPHRGRALAMLLIWINLTDVVGSHNSTAESGMLHFFTEWILDTLDRVPILFGADPHNAALVRALFVLILISLVVYLIAMRPFRSFINQCIVKARAGFARKR
jgi:hypothetical protein